MSVSFKGEGSATFSAAINYFRICGPLHIIVRLFMFNKFEKGHEMTDVQLKNVCKLKWIINNDEQRWQFCTDEKASLRLCGG